MAVTYEHPELGQLTVERLTGLYSPLAAAPRILDVAQAAYRQELETIDLDTRAVPEGTVGRHFDPKSLGAIGRQAARMVRSMVTVGSQYWVLHRQGEFDALAKVSESRASEKQKAGKESPNCYVNDVMVRPYIADGRLVRRGLGSMMLHAALRHGGFDPAKTVVADVLNGRRQSGTAFFRAANFSATDVAGEPVVLNPGAGQVSLSTARYQTSIYLAINALEQSKPWLESGRAVS